MSKAQLNLAIIGVGLIGGSLGLCLKDKLGAAIHITGLCRTRQSMDKAMEVGAVDRRVGSEGRAVGLAAARAVAHDDGAEFAVDLVLHGVAQAAAFEHGGLLDE